MALIRVDNASGSKGLVLEDNKMYKLIANDWGTVAFNGSATVATAQDNYALMFKNDGYSSMTLAFATSSGNLTVNKLTNDGQISGSVHVNNGSYSNIDISGADVVIIDVLTATGTQSLTVSCS